jgi:signal transduction histidine kinase
VTTRPVSVAPQRSRPLPRGGARGPGAEGSALARRLAVADLAEGLAHDLRNQLTVVAASIQMARDGLAEGLDGDLLDRAWRSAMRAARLVDDLLRYCEGDDVGTGAADPAEALESAVAGAWRHCASRRVRLEMRAAEQLPRVRGPAPAVSVLFLYMLRAVADRCPAGGVLVAEVVAEGPDVVLYLRALPEGGAPRQDPEAMPRTEPADAEMLYALAREVGAQLDLAAPAPQVRLGSSAERG